MAIPVYLWLKDDGGSDIKGSVDVIGREGSIEVTSLVNSVEIPTDNMTGKIIGTRIHQPFGFMKGIDSSSVYLYQAVTTGKILSSAEFKFYHINYSGHEVEYANFFLEKVKVISVTPVMYDIKEAEHEKKGHMEAIELCFEKITWTHKDGNIIHSDSWNERKTA